MPQLSTSDAIAKLLQRQPQQPWQDIAADRRLLVVNPDGTQLNFLATDAWCFHAGHAKHWSDSFCQALPPPLSDYRGALVIVAKEQPLNQYILQCLSALPADTPVWLAGEKRGGINSVVKRLPETFSNAKKLASGNHCQLYECRTLHSAEPIQSLTQLSDTITVELSDQNFELISLPGVFSKQRVDEGTRLLLETLPKKLPEPILDFACGNGIIARTIHERQQPQLYACDVNPMATAAAAVNLHHAQAQVILADGLPELPETVGCIVSNPPFHTGLRTDYDIAARFIAKAHSRLKKHGDLYLVANTFLPWAEVITTTFGHCNRIAQTNKFTVYHAKRNT